MAGELIYSLADATKQPIAVASISGIEKETYISADLLTTEYRIVFNLSGSGKVFWSYAVLADRDTAFTNIVAEYGFDAD